MTFPTDKKGRTIQLIFIFPSCFGFDSFCTETVIRVLKEEWRKTDLENY